MRYVTIPMICAHAKKHRSSVVKAMKAAKVASEKAQGVKGLRITERDANKFLMRQWPEVGPLPPINLPSA